MDLRYRPALGRNGDAGAERSSCPITTGLQGRCERLPHRRDGGELGYRRASAAGDGLSTLRGVQKHRGVGGDGQRGALCAGGAGGGQVPVDGLEAGIPDGLLRRAGWIQHGNCDRRGSGHERNCLPADARSFFAWRSDRRRRRPSGGRRGDALPQTPPSRLRRKNHWGG